MNEIQHSRDPIGREGLHRREKREDEGGRKVGGREGKLEEREEEIRKERGAGGKGGRAERKVSGRKKMQAAKVGRLGPCTCYWIPPSRCH